MGIAGWQTATNEVTGKDSEQLFYHTKHQHCGVPLFQKGFPAKARSLSDTSGVRGTAMGISCTSSPGVH